MNKTLSTLIGSSVLVAGFALAVNMPANAFTLSTTNLNTNAGNEGNLASQLSVNVLSNTAGKVTFNISNSGAIDAGAFIDEIYFGNQTLGNYLNISSYTFAEGGGVNFCADASFGGTDQCPNNVGVNPLNPPGPADLNWLAFASESTTSGANQTSIDGGESLGITFDLLNGVTLANLESAFSNGSLQLQFHVKNISATSGNSEMFGTNPPTGGTTTGGTTTGGTAKAPEPGTNAAIGLFGLTAFGFLRKNKKA
jgi:hypothetical protein